MFSIRQNSKGSVLLNQLEEEFRLNSSVCGIGFINFIGCMKINIFFSILFLLVPIFLISYSFLAFAAIGTPRDASLHPTTDVLLQWKTYLSYALLFYSLLIFFIRDFELKHTLQMKLSKSIFITGIVLSFFSYALGGFFVDLTFIISSIIQNI